MYVAAGFPSQLEQIVRIRLSLTLTIDRGPTSEEPHETFESQGALVENMGHPRYNGFTPEKHGDPITGVIGTPEQT